MASGGLEEAWGALTRVLEGALAKLRARSGDAGQSLLAELAHRSSAEGFMTLSRVAETLNEFFERRVRPRWDGEAAAALESAMGALWQTMRQDPAGTRLDAGLDEILSFLREPGRPHERGSAAGAAPPVREPLLESAPFEQGSCEYVIDRLDWYRELLKEDPTSALFCELAELLCAEGHWQEAIQTLREGLLYHPRHMRGHALLGWALWEYGSAEQAEEVLELVRREMAKCAIVYRVLGEIRTHHGDLEEANRLASICELMRMGVYDRPATEQTVPIASAEAVARPRNEQAAQPAAPVAAAAGDARVMDFLNALMSQAPSMTGMEAPKVGLFTAEDRKALEGLLHAHAGGL